MAHVSLFSATIGDGPSRLSLSILRNFDSSDAFIVMLGNDEWPLTVKDAEWLAACGRRIEGALDWAAQHNEKVNLEPYYQRQLGFNDGSAAKIEIGLDELNGVAVPYLEWANRRAIDSTGRLLKALAVLAEATATIRRAEASRRVQDIRINPETFRSPFGWDGRTPWEM
jgi:hypothetical protein